MGHLLSLQWWCPWTSIDKVTYNLVPFWIQIHGILLEGLTARSAKKIRNRLGGLMEIKEPVVDGQILHSYLRMKVNIDINCPLAIGF